MLAHTLFYVAGLVAHACPETGMDFKKIYLVLSTGKEI